MIQAKRLPGFVLDHAANILSAVFGVRVPANTIRAQSRTRDYVSFLTLPGTKILVIDEETLTKLLNDETFLPRGKAPQYPDADHVWYTIDEAAAYLHETRDDVLRWVVEGVIPHTDHGKIPRNPHKLSGDVTAAEDVMDLLIFEEYPFIARKDLDAFAEKRK